MVAHGSSPLVHERRPAVTFLDPQIEMAHGAGGKATRRLVEGLLVPLLHADGAAPLGDAAFVDVAGTRIAMTADAFVVHPLRFPGGSIGDLAVNGTVNDLAVAGAVPQALLLTLVIESGFRGEALRAEIEAVARAARRAGVVIVGGDTKVVEHGKADGIYITTAGIGVADARASLAPALVRPGDRVLLSGHIGDHGSTVMLARGNLEFDADLRSDTRSVWPLVDRLLEVAGPGTRWMRDPTRGGVATALNELAREAGVAVLLREEAIPVRPEVRGVCELLGLDPLHMANEGQFVAVVARDVADAALAALRSTPGGGDAAIIGEIGGAPAGSLVVTSSYGASRLVDMLVGDPLPRIC